MTSLSFWYMLVSLALSLFLIHKLCPGMYTFTYTFLEDDIFIVRKMFHFMALAVFLPVVLTNQKVMVFASNVFTVLFIIVEFSKKYAKGSGNFLEMIHNYENT